MTTDNEESKTMDEVYEQVYKETTKETYTWNELAEKIVWRYFFYVVLLHIGFFAALATYAFGFYSVPVKLSTIIWLLVVYCGSALGITAGAHRLWSHRSYKAKLPLRIFLMILYSAMGLNPLFYWVRDHRVHHKYSETDADPHNAKRGFFFSHFGWVFMKRHPACLRRGLEVNMNDILADSVVMFEKRHEIELKLLFSLVIPIAVPVIFWNETLLHAVLAQLIRYVFGLNIIFTINSVSHLWGNRPYNRRINAAQNTMISFLAIGEGSHNYHHTFPSDYKGSEFPFINFNVTTLFIYVMAKIGWAYDLREPSPELVEKVVRRYGYKSEMKETH